MLFLGLLLVITLAVPLLVERKLHPGSSVLTGAQKALGPYARPVGQLLLFTLAALVIVWMLLWASTLWLLAYELKMWLILLAVVAYLIFVGTLIPRGRA
jgi:hypothetical protein